MKLKRKQIVGNIQFIVESNFKNRDACTAKDILLKIMLDKANEALNKLKEPIPQN
ncbi:MAG: hypothetical protein MJ168_04820 [Clostridia bacterium]|nr:hypothetical protein [Clostridia bacterium]